MDLIWNRVEGSVEPLELDKESSPTTVYLRKNIEKQERKDSETGEISTVWVYDEAWMARSNYAIFLAEKAQADVDYIATMTDVDLDV